MELIDPVFFPRFFSGNLISWARLNFKKDLSLSKGGNWELIWGVALWKIWLWLNKFCFEEEFEKPHNAASIILKVWRSYTLVQDLHNVEHSVMMLQCRWKPTRLWLDHSLGY